MDRNSKEIIILCNVPTYIVPIILCNVPSQSNMTPFRHFISRKGSRILYPWTLGRTNPLFEKKYSCIMNKKEKIFDIIFVLADLTETGCFLCWCIFLLTKCMAC